METEARETPAVAARLVGETGEALRGLGARLRALAPRYALAAGRGSSDAAALLAKYLFEVRLGLPTVSAAPSVRSIYGRAAPAREGAGAGDLAVGPEPGPGRVLPIRDGPDVLRVGLVNDTASPLAEVVDVCVPLWRGPRRASRRPSPASRR